jgi:hypothetical protein
VSVCACVQVKLSAIQRKMHCLFASVRIEEHDTHELLSVSSDDHAQDITSKKVLLTHTHTHTHARARTHTHTHTHTYTHTHTRTQVTQSGCIFFFRVKWKWMGCCLERRRVLVVRARYSFYSLYWYKSTNTDALLEVQDGMLRILVVDDHLVNQKVLVHTHTHTHSLSLTHTHTQTTHTHTHTHTHFVAVE